METDPWQMLAARLTLSSIRRKISWSTYRAKLCTETFWRNPNLHTKWIALSWNQKLWTSFWKNLRNPPKKYPEFFWSNCFFKQKTLNIWLDVYSGLKHLSSSWKKINRWQRIFFWMAVQFWFIDPSRGAHGNIKVPWSCEHLIPFMF